MAHFVDYPGPNPALVTCPVCKAEFRSRSRFKELLSHAEGAHADAHILFRCTKCNGGRTFTSIRAVASHASTCSRTYSQPHTPSINDTPAMGSQVYYSQPASPSFPKDSNLPEDTIRTNLVLQCPYPSVSPDYVACPVCTTKFFGKPKYTTLLSHGLSSHSATVVFSCSLCNKFSSNKLQSIRAHHAVHRSAIVMKDTVVENSCQDSATLVESGRGSVGSQELVRGAEEVELPTVSDSTDDRASVPNKPGASSVYEAAAPRVSRAFGIAAAINRLASVAVQQNHPAYTRLVSSLVDRLFVADAGISARLIDDLMTSYVRYLQPRGKHDQFRSARLDEFGLRPISLGSSAYATFKAFSMAVMRTPQKYAIVARIMHAKVTSEQHIWAEELRSDQDEGQTFPTFVNAVRNATAFPSRTLLRLFASTFQLRVRVLSTCRENEHTICPIKSDNNSFGTRFFLRRMDGFLQLCLPKGCYTRHEFAASIKSRNRALYFRDTTKLAREVLDSGKDIRCPLDPQVVEDYFRSLYGTESSDGCAFPINAAPFEGAQLAQPLDEKEILAAAKSINRSVAAGTDRIKIPRLLNKDPSLSVLTCLANMCLSIGYFPNGWRCNRSVLLPKLGKLFHDGILQKERVRQLDSWRPITISSILMRIVHKALVCRMRACHKFASNQAAMMASGCNHNIEVIKRINLWCRKKRRNLSLAFLDVKAAFDTLDHNAVKLALDAARCPSNLRSYILSSYSNSTTCFEMANGRTKQIVLKRGVKQGDPLSTFLFALAIDDILAGLVPASHGLCDPELGITHLAYADDVVLVADDRAKLQSAIDFVSERFEARGLQLSPSKCCTYAYSHNHGRLAIVDSEPSFTIKGKAISCLSPQDLKVYLGCNPIFPTDASNIPSRIKAMFGALYSAGLSPCQVVHIANDYAITQLIHELVHSDTSFTQLETFCALFRSLCIRALGLPQYINTGFTNLPSRNGGLGIRSILYEVFNQRLMMFESVSSCYPVLFPDRDQAKIDIFNKVCGSSNTTIPFRECWLEHLVESWKGAKTQCLGVDLFTKGMIRRDLISFRYFQGNMAEFKRQVKMRNGLLETNSVLSRFNPARSPACRHCNHPVETNCHALSGCPYVKAALTKRHNKVQQRLVYALRHFAKREFTVEENPTFKMEDGTYRFPDLLLLDSKKREAIVVDVAVPYEVNIEKVLEIYNAKKAKYACLFSHIADKYAIPLSAVSAEAIVVGARGSYSEATINALSTLGLHERTAHNLAQTAAERSLYVFDYFTQKNLTRRKWRGRQRDMPWSRNHAGVARRAVISGSLRGGRTSPTIPAGSQEQGLSEQEDNAPTQRELP